MSVILAAGGAVLVSAVGYVVGAWAMWRAQRGALLTAADVRQNTAAMKALRDGLEGLRLGVDRRLEIVASIAGALAEDDAHLSVRVDRLEALGGELEGLRRGVDRFFERFPPKREATGNIYPGYVHPPSPCPPPSS